MPSDSILKPFKPFRYSFLGKITAFFLLISFTLLNTTGYGFQSLASMENSIVESQSVSPGDIHIPDSLGKIDEIYSPKNPADRLVIYVKDAHANYDSESNLKELINFFREEYHLPLVLLEGGEGKLDSLFFRAFPDEKLKEKILDDYLRKGDLQGGEIASILSDSTTSYYGIEDEALYQENKHAFLQALSKEEELTKKLNEEEKTLLHKSLLSPSIQSFLESYKSFHNEKMNLLEYVKTLLSLRASPRNDVYHNLHKILSAEENEKTLSGPEYDQAMNQLIKDWKTRVVPVPFSLEREINQMIQDYQTGRIHYGVLVKKIEEMRVQAIPAILKPAIHHTKTIQSVKGTKVFEELKELEKELRIRLPKTEKERNLLETFHQLSLLKSLAQLELTHEEWLELERTDLFAHHIRFYELALKRDQALFRNAVKIMDNKKARIALISTGGFHEKGIKQKLKEAGIPFVSIQPNIHEIGTRSNYLNAIQNKRSFMKHFKTTLWDALARDFLIKGLESTHDPVLLKRWRDRIIQKSIQEGRITEAGNYTRYLDGNASNHQIPGARYQIQKELNIFIDRYFSKLKSTLPLTSKSGLAAEMALTHYNRPAFDNRAMVQTSQPKSELRAVQNTAPDENKVPQSPIAFSAKKHSPFSRSMQIAFFFSAVTIIFGFWTGLWMPSLIFSSTAFIIWFMADRVIRHFNRHVFFIQWPDHNGEHVQVLSYQGIITKTPVSIDRAIYEIHQATKNDPAPVRITVYIPWNFTQLTPDQLNEDWKKFTGNTDPAYQMIFRRKIPLLFLRSKILYRALRTTVFTFFIAGIAGSAINIYMQTGGLLWFQSRALLKQIDERTQKAGLSGGEFTHTDLLYKAKDIFDMAIFSPHNEFNGHGGYFGKFHVWAMKNLLTIPNNEYRTHFLNNIWWNYEEYYKNKIYTWLTANENLALRELVPEIIHILHEPNMGNEGDQTTLNGTVLKTLWKMDVREAPQETIWYFQNKWDGEYLTPDLFFALINLALKLDPGNQDSVEAIAKFFARPEIQDSPDYKSPFYGLIDIFMTNNAPFLEKVGDALDQSAHPRGKVILDEIARKRSELRNNKAIDANKSESQLSPRSEAKRAELRNSLTSSASGIYKQLSDENPLDLKIEFFPENKDVPNALLETIHHILMSHPRSELRSNLNDAPEQELPAVSINDLVKILDAAVSSDEDMTHVKRIELSQTHVFWVDDQYIETFREQIQMGYSAVLEALEEELELDFDKLTETLRGKDILKLAAVSNNSKFLLNFFAVGKFMYEWTIVIPKGRIPNARATHITAGGSERIESRRFYRRKVAVHRKRTNKIEIPEDAKAFDESLQRLSDADKKIAALFLEHADLHKLNTEEAVIQFIRDQYTHMLDFLLEHNVVPPEDLCVPAVEKDGNALWEIKSGLLARVAKVLHPDLEFHPDSPYGKRNYFNKIIWNHPDPEFDFSKKSDAELFQNWIGVQRAAHAYGMSRLQQLFSEVEEAGIPVSFMGSDPQPVDVSIKSYPNISSLNHVLKETIDETATSDIASGLQEVAKEYGFKITGLKLSKKHPTHDDDTDTVFTIQLDPPYRTVTEHDFVPEKGKLRSVFIDSETPTQLPDRNGWVIKTVREQSEGWVDETIYGYIEKDPFDGTIKIYRYSKDENHSDYNASEVVTLKPGESEPGFPDESIFKVTATTANSFRIETTKKDIHFFATPIPSRNESIIPEWTGFIWTGTDGKTRNFVSSDGLLMLRQSLLYPEQVTVSGADLQEIFSHSPWRYRENWQQRYQEHAIRYDSKTKTLTVETSSIKYQQEQFTIKNPATGRSEEITAIIKPLPPAGVEGFHFVAQKKTLDTEYREDDATFSQFGTSDGLFDLWQNHSRTDSEYWNLITRDGRHILGNWPYKMTIEDSIVEALGANHEDLLLKGTPYDGKFYRARVIHYDPAKHQLVILLGTNWEPVDIQKTLTINTPPFGEAVQVSVVLKDIHRYPTVEEALRKPKAVAEIARKRSELRKHSEPRTGKILKWVLNNKTLTIFGVGIPIALLIFSLSINFETYYLLSAPILFLVSFFASQNIHAVDRLLNPKHLYLKLENGDGEHFHILQRWTKLNRDEDRRPVSIGEALRIASEEARKNGAIYTVYIPYVSDAYNARYINHNKADYEPQGADFNVIQLKPYKSWGTRVRKIFAAFAYSVLLNFFLLSPATFSILIAFLPAQIKFSPIWLYLPQSSGIGIVEWVTSHALNRTAKEQLSTYNTFDYSLALLSQIFAESALNNATRNHSVLNHQAILQFLEFPDGDVKKNILERIHAEDLRIFIPKIISLLDDTSVTDDGSRSQSTVRFHALAVLFRMHAKEALQPILDRVDSWISDTKSPDQKNLLIVAFNGITRFSDPTDETAIQTLLKITKAQKQKPVSIIEKAKQEWTRDPKNPSVTGETLNRARESINDLFASFETDRENELAIELLGLFLTDFPEHSIRTKILQKIYLEALGNHRLTKMTPAIIQMLKDESNQVIVLEALLTLVSLQTDEAIPVIVEHMEKWAASDDQYLFDHLMQELENYPDFLKKLMGRAKEPLKIEISRSNERSELRYSDETELTHIFRFNLIKLANLVFLSFAASSLYFLFFYQFFNYLFANFTHSPLFLTISHFIQLYVEDGPYSLRYYLLISMFGGLISFSLFNTYYKLLRYWTNVSYTSAIKRNLLPQPEKFVHTAKTKGIELKQIGNWIASSADLRELFLLLQEKDLLSKNSRYRKFGFTKWIERLWPLVENDFKTQFKISPIARKFGLPGYVIRSGNQNFHVIGVAHGSMEIPAQFSKVLELLEHLQEKNISLFSEQLFKYTYKYPYGREIDDHIHANHSIILFLLFLPYSFWIMLLIKLFPSLIEYINSKYSMVQPTYSTDRSSNRGAYMSRFTWDRTDERVKDTVILSGTAHLSETAGTLQELVSAKKKIPGQTRVQNRKLRNRHFSDASKSELRALKHAEIVQKIANKVILDSKDAYFDELLKLIGKKGLSSKSDPFLINQIIDYLRSFLIEEKILKKGEAPDQNLVQTIAADIVKMLRHRNSKQTEILKRARELSRPMDALETRGQLIDQLMELTFPIKPGVISLSPEEKNERSRFILKRLTIIHEALSELKHNLDVELLHSAAQALLENEFRDVYEMLNKLLKNLVSGKDQKLQSVINQVREVLELIPRSELREAETIVLPEYFDGLRLKFEQSNFRPSTALYPASGYDRDSIQLLLELFPTLKRIILVDPKYKNAIRDDFEIRRLISLFGFSGIWSYEIKNENTSSEILLLRVTALDNREIEVVLSGEDYLKLPSETASTDVTWVRLPDEAGILSDKLEFWEKVIRDTKHNGFVLAGAYNTLPFGPAKEKLKPFFAYADPDGFIGKFGNAEEAEITTGDDLFVYRVAQKLGKTATQGRRSELRKLARLRFDLVRQIPHMTSSLIALPGFPAVSTASVAQVFGDYGLDISSTDGDLAIFTSRINRISPHSESLTKIANANDQKTNEADSILNSIERIEQPTVIHHLITADEFSRMTDPSASLDQLFKTIQNFALLNSNVIGLVDLPKNALAKLKLAKPGKNDPIRWISLGNQILVVNRSLENALNYFEELSAVTITQNLGTKSEKLFATDHYVDSPGTPISYEDEAVLADIYTSALFWISQKTSDGLVSFNNGSGVRPKNREALSGIAYLIRMTLELKLAERAQAQSA